MQSCGAYLGECKTATASSPQSAFSRTRRICGRNHTGFDTNAIEGQDRPDCGWTDSPAHQVYGDHPAFQTIAKESYAEANHLCFGQLARNDAFARLVGDMAALAEFHAARWLIACPRVQHSNVYQ